MGMKLALQTEVFVPAENHKWLGSRHGTDIAESITLRGADFLAIFTDGIVPSGVVISKLLTGGDAGLYVPYSSVDGTTKRQTLTRDSTTGTYTMTAGGETTPVLNGTAADFTIAIVGAALRNLAGIEPGDFTITQTSDTVITIDGDIPTIAVNDIDLGPSAQTIVGAVSVAEVEETLKAEGHLFTTTDITTDGNDTPAALFYHGRVVVANLPTNHGLTDAAKADLPLIRYAA